LTEILVADDDASSREVIVEVLDREGYKVAVASSGREALSKIEKSEYDVIVTDLVMPEVDGMKILETARSKELPAEVIMLTGFGSVETAVEAMKRGAYQYLNKPINIKELREVVRKALEKRSLARDNIVLRKSVEERYGFDKIVGQSQAMNEIFSKIRQIAPTSATVLLTGQSGTGKELIAHAIHLNSPRKNKPFLAFNCGALVESLIESELFGHEKGSFTGAVSERKGYFELADGGTLLLDEIGDMPIHTQVKLLRVLETHSFFRVGGTKNIDVDVRVIAATNKNLEELMTEGKFREDLFYRLNVVALNIPPLSSRREDIPLLADTFLKELNHRHSRKIKGFSKDVLDAMTAYIWPGNVRELKNLVEKLVIITEKDTIEISDLPVNIAGSLAIIGKSGFYFPEGMTMDEIEETAIRIAIERNKGNKKQAADSLGMSLRTFYRKIKKMKFENH